MKNEFIAVVERDGTWFVANCAEIPGANGQGRTKEACLESRKAAIEPIQHDRREDGLEGVPDDAEREIIVVGSPASGRLRTLKVPLDVQDPNRLRHGW